MRLLPLFFGFTGCPSDKDTGSDLSQAQKEANANVACAAYTQSICSGIMVRCEAEMIEAWGFGSESYDESAAWEDECYAIVQPDCVEMVMGAEDFDGALYVAGGVCYQGYDYEHYDEASALTCDDIADLDNNFAAEFPYLDLCPCLGTGKWREIATSGYYICY